MYILLQVEYFGNYFTLVNVYAPTQTHENDQISFLNSIRSRLSDIENNIIIGGDLNVVLNPVKDKKGGANNNSKHVKYRTELQAMIDTYELCDIWRVKNEA